MTPAAEARVIALWTQGLTLAAIAGEPCTTPVEEEA
jgi:hypothetical protein